MNTTRLHLIAASLRKEMRRVGAAESLAQIAKSLQAQINQPQQANHQQNVVKQLNSLYEKLSSSPVDDFSPAWRQSVDEMGSSGLFGKALASQLRSAFERNQITPQAALEEVQSLQSSAEQTQAQLDALVQSLEFFDVGEDKLHSDECEIGLIIPRSYVDNNLKDFGSELVNLEKTLLVFSELAAGNRQPLSIRNISSSDLSVFLEYAPEVGACVAIAVERIVALYKQLLEIKKLKRDLVNQDVPEASLAGIDAHAESLVGPKLEEVADELLERYAAETDPERKNELRTELRHSLRKLANRIDRGLNIELRVSLDPDEETEEETETSAAKAQILASAATISHLPQSGEPVLFLPEDGRANQDET